MLSNGQVREGISDRLLADSQSTLLSTLFSSLRRFPGHARKNIIRNIISLVF